MHSSGTAEHMIVMRSALHALAQNQIVVAMTAVATIDASIA